MTLHEPTEAQILAIMQELDVPQETCTQVEGLLARDEKGRARARLLEYARGKFFGDPERFVTYRARLGYTEEEGHTFWDIFSTRKVGT